MSESPNVLAEKLAEEILMTEEELARWTVEDESPGVPAPDPKPSPLPAVVHYTSNLNTILSVVGNCNNKMDRQQYFLEAMKISLQLTAWDLQRPGVSL